MGFLDKLIKGVSGGSTNQCPSCGSELDNEDLRPGAYWCESCGSLFTTQAGELVDVKSLRDSGGGSCEMCQSSLAGGVSYLPYEDGSNSEAYIKCPACGHENTRYGFGED